MQPKASIRRSDQAREAAEILINNSITSDYPPPSAFPRHQQTPNASMITGSLHNSLVNDGDFLHEAVIAGSTTNGRMSAVRRFFCLFVTFDLMFTTLLWIICFVVGFLLTKCSHKNLKKTLIFQITGENIQDVMYQQVVEYNIHTSLFDVVVSTKNKLLQSCTFYTLIEILDGLSLPFCHTYSFLCPFTYQSLVCNCSKYLASHFLWFRKLID